MKKTILVPYFILCITAIILLKCVDETTLPPTETASVIPIPKGTETTFNAVYAAYDQAMSLGELTYTFDTDLYLSGFVISSDKANNFFEELIIQNYPNREAPSHDSRRGIKLLVNVSGLFQEFELGRKVHIQLKGLTVGKLNGVLVLGKTQSLQQIQSYEYRDIILRTSQTAPLYPKKTSIDSLTAKDYNTFIELSDMQFDLNEVTWTYAGEVFDEFDGFRTVVSCRNSHQIRLETSTYSDFKSVRLPIQKGTIKAIYSRNYTDDFDVLIVNSLSDILFENASRCDPFLLNCGTALQHSSTVLLKESFETQQRNRPIDIPGWVHYIEKGSVGWQAYSASGSNASLGISARIGSYQSGEYSNIAWLISPKIDLSTFSDVVLSFKTSNSFADHSLLDVWFSTDWDGNEDTILEATWGIISNAYIVGANDSFTSWYTSGLINLSCSSDGMYIAFKYRGGTHEYFDGTYELDEILVTGN